MSCYIAGWAVERDVARIATDHPALWREIRRFNVPVKLALAAAQRVLPLLESARTARLIGLAPCRPGSPELRKITRELDEGFARGSTKDLRVNPIYTLHAIDNLALSALSIRLENREPVSCLGGAAGQAWEALDEARELIESGAATEVLIVGGDQGNRSWIGPIKPEHETRAEREARQARGIEDDEACGVALVLTAKPQRRKLVAIERVALPEPIVYRTPGIAEDWAIAPHATVGLAGWLASSQSRYEVPHADSDGVDQITLVTEAL